VKFRVFPLVSPDPEDVHRSGVPTRFGHGS
jgi:hypothetical protein